MKINVSKRDGFVDSMSSLKTQKYIDYLESSIDFESDIIQLRCKYEIPDSWFLIPEDEQYLESELAEVASKAIGINDFVDNVEKYDRETQLKVVKKSNEIEHNLYSDCKDLTRKYKLPYNWYTNITWFLVYNTFPTLEMPSIEALRGENFTSKNKYLSDEEYCVNTVHLIISQKLTLKELNRLLEMNWKNIEKVTNNLPNPRRHKWLRSELAKQIASLRDKTDPQLTFPEIAEKLSKEYEDDKDLYEKLTEDYVKNLYFRWKKKVSLTESIS